MNEQLFLFDVKLPLKFCDGDRVVVTFTSEELMTRRTGNEALNGYKATIIKKSPWGGWHVRLDKSCLGRDYAIDERYLKVIYE